MKSKIVLGWQNQMLFAGIAYVLFLFGGASILTAQTANFKAGTKSKFSRTAYGIKPRFSKQRTVPIKFTMMGRPVPGMNG